MGGLAEKGRIDYVLEIMWIQENFFKYIIAVILVLLTTLLLYYNWPVFYFITLFLAAIFLPILFSTILYYILRPLVLFLSRWFPKYFSILIVYAMLSLVVASLIFVFVPEFAQVIHFFSTVKFDSLKEHFAKLLAWLKTYIPLGNLPYFEKMFMDNLPKINAEIYQLLAGLIAAVTGGAIAIGLTPFILYYFLRDDDLFSRFILRFVPNEYQVEVKNILFEIDSTLSGFISAQTTIALIVGSFLFVGYEVIELPYSLSLAVVAMVFYIIPFIGTFLAIIPALLVGISIGLSMAFKVLLVMLVAHLIEANLITPRLVSHSLNIHPLTVILLLLIGGSLFGIVGLILITPAYAIVKVFVWNIYKIFHRQSSFKSSSSSSS